MLRKVYLLLVGLFLFLAVGFAFSQDVIVDNTDSGFTKTGTWITSSYGSYYGTNCFYASIYHTSNAEATWTPTLTSANTCKVYIWYTSGTNRTIDARFSVIHANGTTSLVVNQQTSGAQWVLLGNFAFRSGTSGKVRLINKTQYAESSVCIADAVKFSPSTETVLTDPDEPTAPAASRDTTPEFRSFWNYSWGATMNSASQCSTFISEARTYNFNATMPEIRKCGDAYYKSSVVPMATNITPTTLDILSTILKISHDTTGGKPYMEVHGWMVVNRAYTSSSPSGSIYSVHPEYFSKSSSGATNESGNYFLDPGHPGTVDHLGDVFKDVVQKYPTLDGVNLDYIRYAGDEWGYNAIATTRFAQEYGYAPPILSSNSHWTTWCQYRRDRMYDLVRRIYLEVKAQSYTCKVTAATIGWTPGPGGSTSFDETRTYYEVFQDWPSWMKDGFLDAVTPMDYYDYSGSYDDDYRYWSDFSAETAHSLNRHAYIGPWGGYNTIQNSMNEIYYSRYTSNADGINMYVYHDLVSPVNSTDSYSDRTSFFATVTAQHFTQRVPTPEMTWLTNPSDGMLKGTITVSASNPGPAPYFNGSGASGKLYKSLVEIQNNSTSQTYTCRSDITGFYGFAKIPAGTYSLKVKHPTNGNILVTVSNVVITNGTVQTQNVDIGELVPVELSEFLSE